MEIQEIRKRLKGLIPRLEELKWRSHALGEVVNLTRVFQENKDIFELDSIYHVAQEDFEHDLAAFFLYGYLMAGRLDAVTSHIDDEVGRFLTESMVSVGDEEFPYYMVMSMISRAEERKRRVALRDALVPVHEKVNEFLEQKDALIQKEIPKFSTDYIEVAEVVRLVDLYPLATQAEAFLDITEDAYKRHMDAFLRERMGFDLSQACRCDIPRIFSGLWLAGWFPSDRMVDGLKTVLKGMGLDPTANGRILLDTRDLPKKSPRAACFNIRVPDDVRLTVKPIGGFSDYDALFHEMGHAQHFANTRRTELEFKYMGSLAISETYAFTMEGLLEEPEVLMQMTGMDAAQAREVVRFKALQKLYVSRRYAAKLLYEVQWHSGKAKDLMGEYKKYLSRGYGFPLEDADAMSYRIDHDDLFYSADYLRAWYMQVLLHRVLTKGFGAQWFRNRDAGEALKQLWSYGQGIVPRELAEKFLDGKEFDARDYAQHLIDKLE